MPKKKANSSQLPHQRRNSPNTAAVSKKVKKKPKAKAGLITQVYNLKGKTSKITLPEKVFKVEVKPRTLAQAIRVYLGNQRVGTASTKTRGEVSGGGRKPWRQKGTGKARAGSIRAPQWRGGGIVFGPKPVDSKLKIPKKVKAKALLSTLSAKFAAGNIKIVDNFEKIEPKTKKLVKALEKLNLDNKKILWVVGGQSENLLRAGGNLGNLSFCRVENLTSYKVMAAQVLVFTKVAIEKLTKKVG